MGNSIIIKGADFSAVAVEQITIQGTIVINVIASRSELGTVTGTGMYNEGDTVQISAVAKTNCVFVRWDDGNTEATRSIVVGPISHTYVAIFEIDPTIDIPLELGSPIENEYYTRDTAEVVVRSGFNRYNPIDVSIFAGKTIEINGVLRMGVGASLYSNLENTFTTIRVINTIWRNSSGVANGGSAVFILPENVKNLYLCYDKSWHLEDETVFPGVVATIKAEE